ncbi:PREDICTED: lysine-specific demethylase JMJ25-like isoform X2 [Populus euphratica]|uniref:Lysine-specific demethylase JMJ25-like isoform X2 n=1 Tax=Populus euphratica TaxID=75702 RepID=A0AAJ6U5H7_POPEU|nr:PREDICTED: lysine-specific demethylase JMJ25-like isoform X2 [Populus euphratica]
MDHLRSSSANGEENGGGIPDDLRCKRSDGKQWRCTAMSMPDKTVCEKHYIQAKKRAANSALRASLKKAKRKSIGESDFYLESKSDDFDMPLRNMKVEEDQPLSVSSKRYKEKVRKSQSRYSPETLIRSLRGQNSLKLNNDSQRDVEFEENWRSYKTTTRSTMESSRSRSQRSFDASAMTVSEIVKEYSDASTDASEDIGGQTCHQCRRNDRNSVTWCLKCDKRGFCDSCISEWYSDIPLEEIEKVCPACRGICNCRGCLRGDNMVRIREIPVLDKLQYLHCLLSSVLPIVKQIHHEQCLEVELEQRLRGTDIDLVRAKLNADEQMCCNICRIPIIDYHRHCANCSYDLCLHCCQDLRGASKHGVENEVDENQIDGRSQDNETPLEPVREPRVRLKLSDKYQGWNANNDGSIPCPPKEHGGCNYSSLNLSRIFKMNWAAKLVKNVEEMVSGCKVYDASTPQKSGLNDSTLRQYAHREDSDDNFLYCPLSEDIKADGINKFRKHWVRGEPVIVKQVFDSSSISSWDPMAIWKGIRETSDEKKKGENRTVKAIDCLHWSEVDIDLDQFIQGYSEGRIRENGSPEMLKLKDWPSPSALEEFLLYQRSESISKLPFLEFIHSRVGVLNVAAKLPHYSLQNDVGPKICISYGSHEELGVGDSVINLHFKTRDMVYLLVHTCEAKTKGSQESSSIDPEKSLDEGRLPDISLDGHDIQDEVSTATDKDEKMEDQEAANTTSIEDHGTERTTGVQEVERMETTRVEGVEGMEDQQFKKDSEDIPVEICPGVSWDVFRRQDIPKLTDYLRTCYKDLWKPDNIVNDFVTNPLYDGKVFLNAFHKRQLKEEFGVEPWSFEQHLGQAVFVPAGCPFQARNLQSNVQLGLDFLSPESLGVSARLAEEIRCLPNDHEAKLQVLEVGKMSLYAASSAIKEVQKLVLDPKLGAEIGFEDRNLTAAVAENLEKGAKPRQISCS